MALGVSVSGLYVIRFSVEKVWVISQIDLMRLRKRSAPFLGNESSTARFFNLTHYVAIDLSVSVFTGYHQRAAYLRMVPPRALASSFFFASM